MALKLAHMQVAPENRRKVLDCVAQCVSTLEQKYNVKLPPMTVKFDINSPCLGGQAHTRKSLLRFNPVFLAANTEHYIAQVVPHEVAHIADYQINGEFERFGAKKKRDIHGARWAQLMQDLGRPADRTHSYRLPEDLKQANVRVGKPKPHFIYACACGKQYSFSSLKHAKAQTALLRNAFYSHPACGKEKGKLYYKAPATTNTVPYTPKRITAPTMGSKLDQCYDLYKRWYGQRDYNSRKAMINVFVQEVGCTWSGASTYFNTCKQLAEAGI